MMYSEECVQESSSLATSKYPNGFPSWAVPLFLGLKSTLGVDNPELIFLIASNVACSRVWLFATCKLPDRLDAEPLDSLGESVGFMVNPLEKSDQVIPRSFEGELARLVYCERERWSDGWPTTGRDGVPRGLGLLLNVGSANSSTTWLPRRDS